MEYPKVIANMAGPSTTPRKSRRKQPAVSSDEFDTETERVYQHTRTRTGAVAPVDYSALAPGIEVSESYSAIANFSGLKLFYRERSLCVYGKHS